MHYYVGYRNEGFEFYTKKELYAFIDSTMGIQDIARDRYTLIKELARKRIYYHIYEDSKTFDWVLIPYQYELKDGEDWSGTLIKIPFPAKYK